MGLFGLLWPAIILIALFALLGGGLAWLIGLRGLWALAATPAFAITVIGGASLVAGWLDLRWSLVPCAALALVIAAGIFLVRRRTEVRTIKSPKFSRWWTIAAASAAALSVTVQSAVVIGEPTAISQTFDNVFHLNAIRFILDTGAASPLELGQMTSPNGGVPFYPSAWHSIAAVVVQLSGVSIPAAVNAQTIVTAALMWPLGAMLLARVLLGAGAATTLAAAVVSTAVPMFPLLPMDYGVLYPYQLALATVPAALAGTASVLGVGSNSSDIARGWWALVVVGMIPGVAVAHPGGFVAWLALSVPMVAVFAFRAWRARKGTGQRVGLLLCLAAYVALGVLLLKVLRPPLPTRLWPTVLSPLDAGLEVLQLSMFYGTSAIGLAVAVILGLAWSFRVRRDGTFIAAALWAIGATLFVVVISSTFGTLRDALTGSWYNNWPRLAAVLGVALVPIAVLGIARTAEVLADWRMRGRSVSRRVRIGVTATATLSGFALLPLPAIPTALAEAHDAFVLDAGSPLLSGDELELIERIPEHVPEDAVIAGNPYTGTALAYAISGRRVLMPHILVDVSDDAAMINNHLAKARSLPPVCDAVESLDVRFVLDFGVREVHGGSHPLGGLEDLESSGAVRLIDRQGDAKLFEVTACGIG